MTLLHAATAAVILLGLWWAYCLARRTCSVGISVAAVITVTMGSGVVWSVIREGALRQAIWLTVAAAFALAWTRWRERDDRRSAGLVGLAGLPLVFLMFDAIPPLSDVPLLSPTYVADALWSSRQGLFATSPALYLATLGLIPLWRVNRETATTGVAALVFILGTRTEWAGLIPFLVPGLAAGIAATLRLMARRPGATAAAALALLVLWNVCLVAVARAGRLRIGEIVSFADIGAAQADTLHGWIGHPGSMPANLIFAARNGVSPARFDLLYPNRFLSDAAESDGQVDIGGADAAYLIDGWHGSERDGDRTFRWTDDRARLLVPLDHAAPLLLQLHLRAFEYPGAPAQQLTVDINGHRMAGPLVTGAWQRVDVPTDAALWKSGVNRVALQFSRATRPADVGAGGDTRRLAAAIDAVRIQVIR